MNGPIVKKLTEEQLKELRGGCRRRRSWRRSTRRCRRSTRRHTTRRHTTRRSWSCRRTTRRHSRRGCGVVVVL